MTPPSAWPLHVVRVVHSVRWQDVVAHNVFHFLVDGGPVPAHMEELRAGVHDWYTGLDGGTRLPPSSYAPYNTSEGEVLIEVIVGNAPVPGLSSLSRFVIDTENAGGNVAYPGACALVTWRTAQRHHWGVGRSYVGPVRDSLLAGSAEGRLDPLVLPGLSAAWASLVPRIAAWGSSPGRYRLVLKHAQPHFPSDGPEGLWNYVVSGSIEDARLRTQDRRVPRARLLT